MDICLAIFGQKMAVKYAGAMQQRVVVNRVIKYRALEPMKSLANYQTLRCNVLIDSLRNNLREPGLCRITKSIDSTCGGVNLQH